MLKGGEGIPNCSIAKQSSCSIIRPNNVVFQYVLSSFCKFLALYLPFKSRLPWLQWKLFSAFESAKNVEIRFCYAYIRVLSFIQRCKLPREVLLPLQRIHLFCYWGRSGVPNIFLSHFETRVERNLLSRQDKELMLKHRKKKKPKKGFCTNFCLKFGEPKKNQKKNTPI